MVNDLHLGLYEERLPPGVKATEQEATVPRSKRPMRRNQPERSYTMAEIPEVPGETPVELGATERLLAKAGLPLTRENWIELAYLGNPPSEWTQDLENELPRSIRTDLTRAPYHLQRSLDVWLEENPGASSEEFKAAADSFGF